MAVTSSRRDVLHFGCGTAAAIGVSAVADALGPVPGATQGASASNPSGHKSTMSCLKRTWLRSMIALPSRFH